MGAIFLKKIGLPVDLFVAHSLRNMYVKLKRRGGAEESKFLGVLCGWPLRLLNQLLVWLSAL